MKLRFAVIVISLLGLANPWTLKTVHSKAAGTFSDKVSEAEGDGDGIEPAPDYVPPEPFIPGANEAVALDAIVGPNTLVNSRDLCGGRGNTQSETSMAVSGDVVVVAFNDSRGFFCPARSRVGWAFSFDGGQTFQDGGTLPGGPGPWSNGDPWLTVGPDGAFYVSGISDNFHGMSVSRGTITADGISWSDPVQATFGSGGGIDKEGLAIDPITGSIYMTYDVSSTRVELVRSDDQGATWSLPTVLPSPGGIGQIGAFPIIDANGRLYVIWLVGWPASGQRLYSSSSDDAGQTFSDPVLISYLCPITVSGFSRGQMPAFPSVAIDRSGGAFDGRIYVGFHHSCEVPGNAYVTSSDDGGQSWSVPTQVNDDDPITIAIHFSPTVSVDAAGKLNVFFYDRRENPGTSTTNVYFAQSSDGGATFLPNIRVTEVATTWGATASDITPNFGDYMTSLSVGTDVLITWSDGRSGDPDAYFARLSPAALVQK